MPDIWRRKKNYAPRVLIDTARVLDPQFSDSVLCITGAQLEMLRNLTQYLHRRSSFVSEYHEGHYLCATNEEWDALQAEVAELEETLMGCEEFTAALEDLVAQVACLCAAANQQVRDGIALGPIVETYLTDGTFVPGDTFGDDTAVEDERCDLAQVTYWQASEVVSQLIQPLDDLVLDFLLPAVLGLIGTIIGGPVVGVPAALLITLVRGLIELKATGMLPDVQSAFAAAEEDIICALYTGLETSYRAAEWEAMQVINSLPATSAVAKIALHCMVCPWAIAGAQKALTAETAFAIAHHVPGYCVDCDTVVGTDWYGVYVVPPLGDVLVDHTEPGSYWASNAVCGDMRDGVVCGLVFEPIDGSGCECKPMSTGGACSGDSLSDDTSEVLVNDKEYYFYEDYTHDEQEAVDTLCPGAQMEKMLQPRTGPGDWKVSFHLGYNCVGTRKVRVKWIVYEGAP